MNQDPRVLSTEEMAQQGVEMADGHLGEDAAIKSGQGNDVYQEVEEESTSVQEELVSNEQSTLDSSTAILYEPPSNDNEHSSTLSPTVPTPKKTSNLNINPKLPPPPPSPSFTPRPISTPPGIQVTPPVPDANPSPWGYNGTEEDLQPTWVEGSARRKKWMENGHERTSGVSNGDLSNHLQSGPPTPLSSIPTIPFESISLTDEVDEATTSSAPGQRNVMKRSFSGQESMIAEERKSGLGGFLRHSTTGRNSVSIPPGKTSMSKMSGVGSMARAMTREGSNHEEKDRSSENRVSQAQEASTSTLPPAPSTTQLPFHSPPNTPSPGGRISAPPAIPHTSNPTIAALISKGLDPNTAPSYLATSPVNASPPDAVKSDKKEKRRSFLEGLKVKIEEGKGKGKEIVSPDSEGTMPTRPSNGVNEIHHLSAGPSMLDKVRSQTRQVYLPPKAREEDEAHLRVWEAMMASARAADIKRLERQAGMREERERKMKEDLPVWESILALYGDGNKTEWKEAVKSDPKLGRVWEQGCPSHLRGRVWAMCIGNGLALSKGSFKSCNVRARRAIESGRFPADILKQIDESTSSVFPVLKLFQAGSPLQQELKELICAWYVSRTDEGLGYAPDIPLLAAMLLMTMSLPLAFVALRNLLERGVLRAFYSGLTEESEAYFRIFDNLQADLFPKIYANCKHLGIRLPSSYFTTMFLQQLPFEASCRVWDQILLYGDGYIFRVALAILAILEPRLYFPEKNEIVSILDGRNPATLAIVAREKERARQKGLRFEENVDGVLSIFHVDEKAIFERLADDNWKESWYERLAQRELPDI